MLLMLDRLESGQKIEGVPVSFKILRVTFNLRVTLIVCWPEYSIFKTIKGVVHLKKKIKVFDETIPGFFSPYNALYWEPVKVQKTLSV